MKITNIAALHAPTGQARYGFDFAFESAEVAALLRQKPGLKLVDVCTETITGALQELLAKDARERETQAKLGNGEIEAGRAQEALA